MAKDERFRGMMEFYAIFREIIAHERMSDVNDKSGKMSKMAGQIDEMFKQVNYIDEAMRILSNNVINEKSFVKQPFEHPVPAANGNSENGPKGGAVPSGPGHVMASGIKIFNNPTPAPVQSNGKSSKNSSSH